jgi:ATP/maltotriose-dependent transcriptional regulator MalT
MAGELRELRDRDLYFSLAESGDLLANFGVQVVPADLTLLHQRSEGWAAALQMAHYRCAGNTVKAHLRSVYQKLGVTSRSQGIERAVDLRLL